MATSPPDSPPQRQRRAMMPTTSSVSAPVSPSASFASLEVLRNSIAMRSGDLDLDESAHTFPISDEAVPRASSSASSPSSPRLSMSSSSTPRGLRRPKSRTSIDRRIRSESTSSSPASPSSALPMISPLSPLSMTNLPSSSLFPHSSERRLSPFHDFRGTGFTPATTPPAMESPRLSPLETGSWPAPVRAAAGGSSAGSGSLSSSASARPSGSRSHSGRQQQHSSSRNRLRSSSDVAGGSAPGSRRNSGHFSSVATSSSSRRRTRHRSNSGASLTSSQGFPESDASDTGEEGDVEVGAGEGTGIRCNGNARPVRPGRTHSSPHLHFQSASLPIGLPSSSTGNHTYDGAWQTMVMDAAQRSPVGYFGISPSGGEGGISPGDPRLWQLHAAALGAAAGLDTAVNGLSDAASPHHMPADVREMLPPPPPYQANDADFPPPRPANAVDGASINAQAAADMDDDDGLAFETRRNRGHSASASVPLQQHGVAPSSAIGEARRRISTTPAPPTRAQAPDAEEAAQPPAWQPKSDTEGEEANEVSHSRTTSSTRSRRERRPPTRSEGRSTANDHRRRLPATSSRRVTEVSADKDDDSDDDGFSPWLLRLLLHPLRMLAAVPGFVGTFWLLRNTALHMSRSTPRGSLLQKGRLLNVAEYPHARATCGLDFLLASLWALCTAYHALSLTTLLLRRWLIYYSLFPSLIRLIALQAICWPLVRLTIFVAGPDRPVEAWIVIASFTAFSDVVARWVTSNIADAPTQRAPPSGGSTRNGRMQGSSSRASALHTPTVGSSRSRASSRERTPASTLAGGESGPAIRPSRPTYTPGRVRAGQRFWRAIMGSAPFDSSTSDEESGDEDEGPVDEGALLAAEERQQERNGVLIKTSALDSIGRSGMTNILLRRLRGMRAAGRKNTSPAREDAAATTDDGGGGVTGAEDSVLEGETTDPGLTTAGLTGLDDDDDDEDLHDSLQLQDGETPTEALRRLRLALRRRRRRRRMREKVWAVSGWGLTASAAASNRAAAVAAATMKGSWHIRSRRVFHWEVAVRRNVAPIGALAYVTLWGLLLAR
ncbi:hypothetical protein BDZ90DRAFT_277433 [Jaminaea rosea]|uniref:Myp1 protein n=1 Tax=Jaminaea rosea TaxID=1569628 RepID=A0A316V0M0_9BASI|nr:hypothetical protein BDZ90DRAFT_277433 [Jaminaea rosea]PWN31022.1 hypothetical protein BDZ90DRAFT_277433 [Jaminaea rosea]